MLPDGFKEITQGGCRRACVRGYLSIEHGAKYGKSHRSDGFSL
jgi:hypothetical protein